MSILTNIIILKNKFTKIGLDKPWWYIDLIRYMTNTS